MEQSSKIFKYATTAKPAAGFAVASELNANNGDAVIGFLIKLVITARINNLLKDGLNLKALFFADENTHTVVEIITAYFDTMTQMIFGNSNLTLKRCGI